MESSWFVTAWIQGKVLSLSVTSLLHMCYNGHVAHTKNTCSFMLPSSVASVHQLPAVNKYLYSLITTWDWCCTAVKMGYDIIKGTE